MHGSHIVTAFAYYVIGLTLLVVAARVLAAHPVNRVFIFGKHLTADGVREVIRHWPLVSLFGLFIFACGIEHHVHWYYAGGHKEAGMFLAFMGWIEAGISVITAGVVVSILIRRGVRRCSKD